MIDVPMGVLPKPKATQASVKHLINGKEQLATPPLVTPPVTSDYKGVLPKPKATQAAVINGEKQLSTPPLVTPPVAPD